MISLTHLILLLALIVGAWLFWLRRGMAEAAKAHIQRYCQQHTLQLISVSRRRLTLAMIRGRPGWKGEFQFEFTGNREDKYTGVLLMQNHYATKIEVPPYRTMAE